MLEVRSHSCLPCHAHVCSRVYSSACTLDFPAFFGDGMTNLSWLTKLVTPALIAHFIVAVESDGDLRNLDLWQVGGARRMVCRQQEVGGWQ